MQMTTEQLAGLNPLWQLPPRLRVFTGRDDQLKSVQQAFAEQHQNMVIHQAQQISGTGGIGKTQLAVESAYRLYESKRFSHVFWLNADCSSGDQLATEFRAFAVALALTVKHPDIKVVIGEVYTKLAGLGNVLIVFDNASSYHQLNVYLPNALNNISILATTRDASSWTNHFHHLPLDIFSESEAVQYIEKVLPSPQFDLQQAKNLAVRLGLFPLALAQATAYIRNTNIGIENYLQLFNSAHKIKMLDKPLLQSDPHQETIWITINLCLEKITDRLTLELLHCCAFLAPESPIDHELMSELSEDKSMGANCWDKLLHYGLVDLTGATHHMKLHQMVQEILR